MSSSAMRLLASIRKAAAKVVVALLGVFPERTRASGQLHPRLSDQWAANRDMSLARQSAGRTETRASTPLLLRDHSLAEDSKQLARLLRNTAWICLGEGSV